MEQLDGIRATAEIKARFIDARIMILIQYDDPNLRAAAKAGASGYVLKNNLLCLQTMIQAQTSTPTNGHDGGVPLPAL